MAFNHLAGITTAGAPDEIVDWFATFEAWITGTVGWTVQSGAGTTNLVISSVGESGTMTKLFVHIWRVGVGNTVRMEVRDDALGTHETTGGSILDSNGAQFPFWISADLDAIVMCWKAGAGYTANYAGLLMPFALNPTDETYYSVTWRGGAHQGTILRRHDNLWDQDDTHYYNDYIHNCIIDPDDGSLPIGGMYFADHADIAGQFKHIGCWHTIGGVNPEDTIESYEPGGTTTWIVMRCGAGTRFAMRTGGVLPTGIPDSASFLHSSGNAANHGAWFFALRAHLIATGWSYTDISGLTGNIIDEEYHSAGESGSENIYMRVYWQGFPPAICFAVADSTYGTPGRNQTTLAAPGWVAGDFPTQYYISGDKDCVLCTINKGGDYKPAWAGCISSMAQNLSSIYMKYAVCIQTGALTHILQDHTGAWDQFAAADAQGDGGHTTASQPSNYDGTTYFVWPHLLTTGGVGPHTIYGQLKYFFFTDGGGIAIADTITVGGRVYTIFAYASAGWKFWAMRTA